MNIKKFNHITKWDHFLTKAGRSFVMIAIYFSISILSCVRMMKSANCVSFVRLWKEWDRNIFYILHISLTSILMAVYNSFVGCSRTSACKGASDISFIITYMSSCILFSPPTRPTRKCWKKEMKSEKEEDLTSGNCAPFSFRTMCGFFNVPHIIGNKCCEMGPAVYRS